MRLAKNTCLWLLLCLGITFASKSEFIAVADTYVDKQSPQGINGESTTLMSGHTYGDYARDIFLKFDLSQASLSKIKRAKLKIYCKGLIWGDYGEQMGAGVGNPVEIYHLDYFPWTEQDLSWPQWAEIKGEILAKKYISMLTINPVQFKGKYVEFQFSESIVESWIASPNLNDGIVLLNRTFNLNFHEIDFASRETEFPPILEVEWEE